MNGDPHRADGHRGARADLASAPGLLSEAALRRWCAAAVAVAFALAVLSALHLVRHQAIPAEQRPRWGGQEWLLVSVSGLQLFIVLGARAVLLRDRRRRDAHGAATLRRLAGLEETLDGIGDGFAIWSAEGRLLAWNRRFAALTGADPAALHEGMTRAAFDARSAVLLFPPTHEAARATWMAARQEGSVRADGTPHEFTTRFGCRIEIRDRRVAGGEIATVVRDVTASHQAELRLAESEARFRDGIENMADGFLLWDADDRLVAINRRARELLPHLADMRMIGRTFSDCVHEALERGRPDLDAQQRAAWLRRRLEKRRRLEPHELYPATGAVVVALERRTSQGGIVQLLRDVTAERRARELTEKALVVEREGSAQQRRFASLAGHEFRTPLAIIDGAVQRIEARLEAAPPAELRLRLTRIREAVARMTTLIDTTLARWRRDHGLHAPAPGEFDLAALLREIVARQAVLSPRFRIALDAPDRPVPLVADRVLVDEALTNLISNAVKFSPGGDRVEVAVESRGGDVTITVRDFGVGIPDDEVPKLFERAFRARTAGAAPGTGIGLHLVRELVELHGGSVRVTSSPGDGSTFAVHLPGRPAPLLRAAD